MSIAVLRTYIAKRKEEHDGYLSKKGKSEKKVSESKHSGSVTEATSSSQDDKANGGTDIQPNQSLDVTEDISKECIETPFWKGPRELKAPRVLEVSYLFSSLHMCNLLDICVANV